MPRYYFHIRHAGEFIQDEKGFDLPDLEAAQKQAREMAHQIAVDSVRNHRPSGGDMVEVTDWDALILSVVSAQDILH